jgi:RHS repeat-associated protein
MEKDDVSPHQDYAKNNLIDIPTINLPKGGGAIKSIDEKFSVNAVNGTAAFSIPLPVSAARGVTPALTLTYNSGSGNGIFGLGWDAGLPSIKRETSKGLPRYYDAIDSDIFLFSEAEDLVPDLQRKEQPSADNLYTIRYYRPRIEGLFARIERWTDMATGIIKWRVINKENVTTLFGSWQNTCVIANPVDPTKIYKWLPEFVFDDKGNCCQYIYLPEDSTGFDNTQLHNGHRSVGGVITYTNLYLSRVLYGNRTPYQQLNAPYPAATDFMFQTVFDYGTLNETGPNPDPVTMVKPWDFRTDAFSDYKAGFEIRTTRLCKRVLLFHFFSGFPAGGLLVKSLNFGYDTASENGFTFLQSITSYGYNQQTNGTYISGTLPPMVFAYQPVDWNSTVNVLSADNLANAPAGLDESLYEFTDLFNEGLSGILSEQAGGWYYKHNLGGGNFEPAKLVSPKPSFTGLGNQLQLADLDGDGGKQLVNYGSNPKGYFDLYDFDGWQPFRPFPSLPTIDLKDRNTRMIDLNGDGVPDVLITEHNVFTWYESYGREGFSEARRAFQSYDEEEGPRVVFADPTQSIYLADMSGDGLTDIVRIRNGEVSYWPNLGFGKFGARIGMDNAPVFDYPDAFNPANIKLADIDGSGTTDIIYLGPNKFTCWFNLSGNAFPVAPFAINAFPEINSRVKVTVTDLLGNGVPCIVWSSPLPQDGNTPLKYIDLMDGKKPHIMVSYSNGLGKEVSLQYTASTVFYIQDRLAGAPWVTKLHFPVQCVSTVTISDAVSDTAITSQYTYHHGYYDHPEKEFRGFGRVEQTDAEVFDVSSNPLDQPVVLTKNWYHTGAYLGINRILNQLAAEYFQNKSGFVECVLPEPILPLSYTTLELREALRSCKGLALRQEVYGLDATLNPVLAPIPYTAVQHNYGIQLLQQRGNTRYAYGVFLTTESEAITYHYERNPADPRILHHFNLQTDQLGNVTQALTVVYQREPIADLTSPGGITLPGGQSIPSRVVTEQQTTYFTANANQFIPPIDDADDYRHSVQYEAIAYQLDGLVLGAGERYYTFAELQPVVGAILTTNNSPQRRKLKHKRVLFATNTALDTPLGFGVMQSLGIEYASYHLAFTDIILNTAVLNGYFSAALLPGGAYKASTDLAFPAPVDSTTEWWVPSGTKGYGATPAASFYLPVSYVDVFGNMSVIGYEGNNLLIASIKDPVGNLTAASYDYRVLLPVTVTDVNSNITSFVFDVHGLVVGVALNGKIAGGGASEADNLTGFSADLDAATVAGFFADPLGQGAALLMNATSRFIYDFTVSPVRTCTIARENHTNHFTDPRLEIVEGALQYSFEYADGFGRVAMKKVQADFAIMSAGNQNNCINDGVTPRWIGKGKTVWNNKANPVMQYEPYFSATPAYEVIPPTGVSPVLYYDPIGRVIKTSFPDGTLSYTGFDAWMEIVYDQNDAAEDGPWWVSNSASPDPIIQDVVAKTKVHYRTPTINYYDTSGRTFYIVAYNTYLDAGNNLVSQFFHTQNVLDIEGNLLTVLDDIAISGNVATRAVMQNLYDLLNEIIYSNSMDAGQRWLLNDCFNKPYYKWDTNEVGGTTYNYQYTFVYDALRRPTQSLVSINGASAGILEFIQYGDDPTAGGGGSASNLLGKVYKSYDGAGLATNYQFDFKGNLMESSRIAMGDYTTMPVWTTGVNGNNALLQGDEYISQTQYDALNRIVMITAPYLTTTAATADVLVHGFGEAGLLKTVDAYLRGSGTATSFVKNICHNEKDQRSCIWYGNDMVTRYSYDPDTFRLTNLTTTASAQQTGNTYGFQTLQNLNYTYDPVGNITYINDLAQTTVFTNNQQVAPTASYTYDAVYRLIRATGRQHAGQNLPANYPPTNNDASWMVTNPAPGDMTQLQNYVQSYVYDSVGNMQGMKNVSSQPAGAGNWSRAFTYTTGNNQLVNANPDDIDSNAASGITYPYDTHGNMLKMAHLNVLDWNVKDELQHVNLLGGGDAYYQYDGAGQRVRKVWVKPGALVCDRIYLNGFEVYVEKNGATVNLRRETLHIFDDKQRIALVETKTIDQQKGDAASLNTAYIRYQHSNHLGTSCLELDEQANIISYEEYYPFGSTSYQALNTGNNPIAKRYRYTGKERDEESGLYYHGARYYAPWLCRWTAADPIGIGDGVNVYSYVSNRPIILHDPAGKDGDVPPVIANAAPQLNPNPPIDLFPKNVLDAIVGPPPPPPPIPPPKKLGLTLSLPKLTWQHGGPYAQVKLDLKGLAASGKISPTVGDSVTATAGTSASVEWLHDNSALKVSSNYGHGITVDSRTLLTKDLKLEVSVTAQVGGTSSGAVTGQLSLIYRGAPQLPLPTELATGVRQIQTGVNEVVHDGPNISELVNDPKVAEIGTGAGPVKKLLPPTVDPLDDRGVKRDPDPDAKKQADQHPKTTPYRPSGRLDLILQNSLTDPSGLPKPGFQATLKATFFF